jgi:hypothetical protein
LRPKNRLHPSLGFVIQLFAIRAAMLLAGVSPGSLADIDEMTSKPGYMCSRSSDGNLRDLAAIMGQVVSLLRGNSLAPLPALAPQDLQTTSGLSGHQAILLLTQGCCHLPKLVRMICQHCIMKHRLLAIPAVRSHLFQVEMDALTRNVTWGDLPLPPRAPAVIFNGWGFLSQTSIMELAMTRTRPLPSRLAVDSPHAVDSLGQVGRAPAEIIESCLQAVASISNIIILELLGLIPAALSHRGATEERSSLGTRVPFGFLAITNRPTPSVGSTGDRHSQLGQQEKAALLACAVELLTRARLAAADICRFRAISATIRRAVKPPLLPEQGTVFISTVPARVGSSRLRTETSRTLTDWGSFCPAEVTHILVVTSDRERASLASQSHTTTLTPGAHPPAPFDPPDVMD